MALTSKQEKFVQGLVKGKSQRHAYLDAGYSDQNGQLDRVDVQASKLIADAKVLQRYNDLNAKVLAKVEKELVFTKEKGTKILMDLINRAHKKSLEEFKSEVMEDGSTILTKPLDLNDLAKIVTPAVKELNSAWGINSKNINLDASVVGDFEIIIKGDK